MPIYEYRCDDCDHVFERLARVTARPDLSCPECGGAQVHKLMSTFGFAGDAIRSSTSGVSCSDCSSGSCHGCSCH